MLRELPLPYRPREKLFRFGPEALRDDELWCALLGFGTRKHGVQELANKVEFWWRDQSGQLPIPSELGLAQKARVSALRELFNRTKNRDGLRLERLHDALLLSQELVSKRQEYVKVWYCSSQAEIIHTEVVALGSLNAAYLEPKEVFSALRVVAFDSLLVVHNHPSGDPTPSAADLIFTKRLEAACEIMGCWLRDHIIVAQKGHYSFRENGQLLGTETVSPG